jgi:flagellar biosynthetic protein FliQ
MPYYLQLLHSALAVELAQIVPVIGILLIVGLITAIFQAAVQMEDTAFSLLPKLLAMIALGLFGGVGVMQGFEHLATGWITQAPLMVSQSWR